LGVPKNSSDDDIRKAYRKLALQWHPDRHSGSEEQTKMATQKFQDIGEAYTVLSDPKKKRDYDSGVDLMDLGGGGGGYGDGGVDVHNVFNMFFGGDMGGGGMGGGGGFSSGGPGMKFFFRG